MQMAHRRAAGGGAAVRPPAEHLGASQPAVDGRTGHGRRFCGREGCWCGGSPAVVLPQHHVSMELRSRAQERRPGGSHSGNVCPRPSCCRAGGRQNPLQRAWHVGWRAACIGLREAKHPIRRTLRAARVCSRVTCIGKSRRRVAAHCSGSGGAAGGVLTAHSYARLAAAPRGPGAPTRPARPSLAL